MDIHTTHRHLIAAPLLGLALLASFFLSSGARMTGALPEAASNGGELFREGTVLLWDEGIVELSVPAGLIVAFHGGLHVSQYSDMLTIAAITTPVILMTDTGLLLVPAGMQWRGNPVELPTLENGFNAWVAARHVEPLPSDFLQEQMATLEHTDSELPPAESSMPSRKGFTSLLRFSEAREREEELWEQRVFGHLRYLLEQGMIQEARDLLTQKEAFFASSSLTETLFLIFLARNSTDAGVAMELLQRIPDEDVRTLAALHPNYRDVAWTMEDLSASEESLLVRLLTFPVSDIAYEGISELAVSKWLSDAEAYSASLSDPTPFLTELTTVLLDVIERSSVLGYPEREARYRDAVLALTKAREEYLSDTLRTELRTLAASARVSLDETVAAEPAEILEEASEEEPMPEATPPANAAKLESQAYGILKNLGALFTVETKFQAISEDRVSVTGILFSATDHDRTVSLTLRLSDLHVSAIMVDNERLPYGMALAEFVEWIRQ